MAAVWWGDTTTNQKLASTVGAALKRRGDRGGTCGGVLSLRLERWIDKEKKWQQKYVLALDGRWWMKITQQPTKSTPAWQRRWRRGVATGEGSTGEVQIDRLGAIKLGSISKFTKKNISLPDHRVNKKPCTLPLDNLLQRGYLKGIGWLHMAMLLGPANNSTMVRDVLDVHEGALPPNLPRFKYKHSKNKMLRVFQMVSASQTIVLFFPVVICNLIKEPAKKHSYEPATTIQHCNRWPDNCTFFPVIIWSRNPPKQSKLMEPPNIPTDGQTTVFSGRNLIDEGTHQKT
jgi:hypothetical protein